jgi:hypothetical protein
VRHREGGYSKSYLKSQRRGKFEKGRKEVAWWVEEVVRFGF